MSRSRTLDRLVRLLQGNYSSFGVAASVMLTWLMKTDGNISSKETKVLNDFLSQFNLLSESLFFERIIDDFDSDCIELASDILRKDIDEEGQRLILDLFLGMIIADGYITHTEVYVIEFIADLFSISSSKLNQIFIEATGRSKIEPGDPSSADWWSQREKKQKKKYKKQKEQKRQQNKSNKRDTLNTKRQRALAILGLERGATKKEIKKTFRLLTKIHHPDRFHKLGDEAKKSANSTYIRIKNAYEYLMAS